MKRLFAIVLALLICVSCAYAEDGAGMLAGGWQYADAITLPEGAQEAFDKAVAEMDPENVYEPMMLIGTQVVAGINYYVLSKTFDEEYGCVELYLMTIYADLEGNASVTNIEWIAPEYDFGYEELEEFPGELELSEDGKILTVRLAANPTTGYDWEFTIDDESIAELVTCEYVPDEAADDMVGVGGTFVASFMATIGEGDTVNPGVAMIAFNYKRSWEEEAITELLLFVEVLEDGTLDYTWF